MPLVKRLIKGSPLTYQEMDDNLSYLDNKVTGSNGNIAIFSGSVAISGSNTFRKVGSDILITGSLRVSNSITASYFVGDGSGLTNLPGGGTSFQISTGSSIVSVSDDNSKIFSIIKGGVNYGQIDDNLSNTSFGQNTLLSGSIGYNNTAFGSYTLGSNTSGSRNTALGWLSLTANQIGDDNVAIGGASLFSNISGSQNTVLGTSAGQSNISGSGNVFLGYAAGLNEEGSNKLYISNTQTSSPLIKGDFASGSVIINSVLTLSPLGTLPSGFPSGSIAVSGSNGDCKPYFYNGTTWTVMF